MSPGDVLLEEAASAAPRPGPALGAPPDRPERAADPRVAGRHARASPSCSSGSRSPSWRRSIAPYSPTALVGKVIQPPSARHWLGTDEIGRDVLSRIIWGSQTILLLAPTAVAAALVVGGLMGLVAGYRGGLVDELIMRLSDIILAFPVLLLYMIIIAAVGPSALNIVFAVTFASSPAIARIVRSLVLELQEPRVRRRRAAPRRVRLVHHAGGDPAEREGPAHRRHLHPHRLRRVHHRHARLPRARPPAAHARLGRHGQRRRATTSSSRPGWPAFPALAISSLVVGLNLFADGLREISPRRTDGAAASSSQDLAIAYATRAGEVQAVRDVSLAIERGQALRAGRRVRLRQDVGGVGDHGVSRAERPGRGGAGPLRGPGPRDACRPRSSGRCGAGGSPWSTRTP